MLNNRPNKRFKASGPIPIQFDEFEQHDFEPLLLNALQPEYNNIPVEVDPKFFGHDDFDDSDSEEHFGNS